eukprot:233905_1
MWQSNTQHRYQHTSFIKYKYLCNMAMYEPSKNGHGSSNTNSNNNNNNNNNNANKNKNKNDLLSQIDISMIITGCKDQGAKQYQEDSFCTFESPDLTFLVAGVFDGHGGLNGQVASQIVSKLTLEYFSKNWQKCKEWSNKQWTDNMDIFYDQLHQKVRDEFIQLELTRRKHSKLPTTNINDNGVVRKSSGFPVHGGTTCTIACIIRTDTKWRIICSNTGDSDALLLSRKPSRLPGDNNKCKHLSVDHSPDNADEFLRIKNLATDSYPTKLLFVYDQANTCRKFECPIVFLEDGTKDPKYVKNPWGNHLRPTNVRYDPAVYAVSPYGVSHDITCIAMTRSLGDFYAHQFGLTNKPSTTFNELPINKCEYIITVGSDGVWDCWKWDDFSDYVNGVMTKYQNNLYNVCKTVLKHTIQRAKACFGEGSYDDATLVCVALRESLFNPITNTNSNDKYINKLKNKSISPSPNNNNNNN